MEFIAYPSEVHLWEGLLAFERKRGVFFSSDLMFDFGSESMKESDWAAEIKNIRHEQVPDLEKRAVLQQDLFKIKPSFIAAGHGPCLKLK
jgi:hypothetical protein